MTDFNRRLIAPSMLASDWSRMREETARAREAGADLLHLDVMDGHFVDNITFGPQFVAAVRNTTDLFLDVHLMIERPDRYWERFVEAGANNITIHVEAQHDVADTLQKIRAAGCKCGLSIRPNTDFSEARPFLDQIDLLLCMTVMPGWGGQAFMEKEAMPKVAAAREERDKRGLAYHIEVDGGVDENTVHIAARNGANVMVSGTTLFKAEDMRAAIEALREEK